MIKINGTITGKNADPAGEPRFRIHGIGFYRPVGGDAAQFAAQCAVMSEISMRPASGLIPIAAFPADTVLPLPAALEGGGGGVDGVHQRDARHAQPPPRTSSPATS